MYACVLFDFDGTVFDTVEGITKSVRYALNQHGMDAPLASLRCFAGPPLFEKFIEVFGVSEELSHMLIDDFRERYKPIGLYECRVFPGIRELLQKLRQAGIKTAVTTLKLQEHAETLLEREGMRELFDGVFGCTEAQHETKQMMVEKAMAALGVSPQETILVGDTKYDVLGAHAAGIPVIGVRYGYAAPGELEEAGADHLLADPAELEQFLLP